MARHKQSTEEYAIKFFARRADFDGEAALYADSCSALFSFLPKVRDTAFVQYMIDIGYALGISTVTSYSGAKTYRTIP